MGKPAYPIKYEIYLRKGMTLQQSDINLFVVNYEEKEDREQNNGRERERERKSYYRDYIRVKD